MARRAARFPAPETRAKLAVSTAIGDGLALAEAVGARQAQGLASPAALCPVLLVRWPDGSRGTFPHVIERGKPSLIAVRTDGRRFFHQGLGDQDDVTALLAAPPPGQMP